MTKISRILLVMILVLSNLKTSFSQVDSVVVTFKEEASDSLGPWTLKSQDIDSLDSDGKLFSKTTRNWNGSNWINDRTETFLYNPSGQLIEQSNLIWDGASFSANTKIEKTYNSFGMLISEINLQYNLNSWVPLSKSEYNYSAGLTERSITNYIYTGSNWNETDQHILTYNSNDDLLSDLWKSRDGLSWDTIRLLKQSFSGSNSKILTDSIFNYVSPYFLPYQSSQYMYDVNGNLETKITQDFYAFLYTDPDTEYIFTEIGFEYILQMNSNASGQFSEQHGRQSAGSFQELVFEHNYFQYNSSGLLSAYYSHKGSNMSEFYHRQSTFYYALLQANFTANGTTCIGCANGSVQVNAQGGIPAYSVHLNSGTGTVNGMTVENLPMGLHQICVSDSIGNDVCQNIFIQENQTGLENTIQTRTDFKITTLADQSGFSVETNSSKDLAFYLFDISGRIILQQILQSGITYLPSNVLPAGIYYYSAFNQDFSKKGKLLNIADGLH